VVDVKVPGLGEVVETGDEAVETFERVADNGHVIGVEEDLDKFGEFVAAKMLDLEFAVDCVLESESRDVTDRGAAGARPSANPAPRPLRGSCARCDSKFSVDCPPNSQKFSLRGRQSRRKMSNVQLISARKSEFFAVWCKNFSKIANSVGSSTSGQSFQLCAHKLMENDGFSTSQHRPPPPLSDPRACMAPRCYIPRDTFVDVLEGLGDDVIAIESIESIKSIKQINHSKPTCRISPIFPIQILSMKSVTLIHGIKSIKSIYDQTNRSNQ
jgi:hypothetical protein